MAKICCVCSQKIKLLSRIVSVKCQNCGNTSHSSCSRLVFDYEAFIRKKITQDTFCANCANMNSRKFGEKRYCDICRKDISLGQTKKAICEICGEIVCSSCMKQTVIPDNILNDNDFNNYLVCASHYDELQDSINSNETLQFAIRAYDKGYEEGHDNGYEEGYEIGHEEGYEEGHSKGYSDGYDDGYSDGEE